MAQPNKKPAKDRQRRNKPKVVDIREYRKLPIPKPPKGLLATSTAWWKIFWTSEVVLSTHAATDVPAIERLVSLIDLRERARQEVIAAPLVPGSRGNLVENPLAKAMRSYDNLIANLEDRFGLTPRARLNLGITLGHAKRTLEDLTWSDDDEDQEPEIEDLDGVIDV